MMARWPAVMARLLGFLGGELWRKTFDVSASGTISNGRVFFDATAWTEKQTGLPDGMKLDKEGNIFATAPTRSFHLRLALLKDRRVFFKFNGVLLWFCVQG